MAAIRSFDPMCELCLTHYELKRSKLFVFLLRGTALATAVLCTSTLQSSSQTSEGSGRNPQLIAAEMLLKEGKYDEAISTGRSALKSAHISGSTADDIVIAHNLLGVAYCKKRSYDSAFRNLDYGLHFALARLKKDHPVLGDCYYYRGIYYDLMGNGEDALSNHKLALEIRRTNYGENRLKVAESLNGIGEVYMYTLFDFKKAQENFRSSVEILNMILPSASYELYVGYYNLASANRKLGDLDIALTYAFNALAVVNAKKEFSMHTQKCYTLIGDVYYSKADYAQAIDFQQKGIDLSIREDGKTNYGLIRKYTNLGVTFTQIKDWSSALNCFKKSLSIYKLHTHSNELLKATTYRHMGKLFQRSGNFDSSEVYFRKALAIQTGFNGLFHVKTREAMEDMATLFQKAGAADSALFYVQNSLKATIHEFQPADSFENPDIRVIADRADLFLVFSLKGLILSDLNAQKTNQDALRAALACYRIADQLMDLNRNTYQREESKLFFADHYHAIYENAIEVAHALFVQTKDDRYINEALLFMEKNKAFVLAESLQKAELLSEAGIPDSIRSLERNILSQLSACRSALETNKSRKDNAAIEKIQSQLFELTQKQERLLSMLQKQHPNYFNIKYKGLSGMKPLQDIARKKSALIIEYFWGTQGVFVVGVSSSKAAFRKVINTEGLQNNILAYLHQLQPGTTDNDLATFARNAYEIYQQLVLPLMGEFDPVENIIIVRDGPLLTIPFESLLTALPKASLSDYRHLDYMVRKFVISYSHSANLLVKNAGRKNISAKNELLAFSFSSNNNRRILDKSSTENEVDLPGTARELDAIAEYFSGNFIRGDEATEQRFKLLAGDYDILHLAVHGRVNENKQFSGSLLFKHSLDSVDDGELEMQELYNLRLNAKLVVLSACESGVGRMHKGEGVFSISRGFDYAGCPSTIITLWKIGDVTSAKIMSAFYKELRQGVAIDVALRNAKLQYIEASHSKLAHPAFWAAFVPVGQMDPIVGNNWMLWASLAGLLVLAIAIVVVKKKQESAKKNREDRKRELA
jgi:CHAT domain-containing protein